MSNAENIDLVYNVKNTYWLASNCVYADFGIDEATFYMYCVDPIIVDTRDLFRSSNVSLNITWTIRPVVTLNSNVKLSPNADKTEWAIS